MIGELVLRKNLSGQQKYEIDVSSSPSGAYLVRAIRGGEIGVEKVVKQ